MDPVIKRILVPTDFSDAADEALGYAHTVGAQVGASPHCTSYASSLSSAR